MFLVYIIVVRCREKDRTELYVGCIVNLMKSSLYLKMTITKRPCKICCSQKMS